MNLGWLAFVFVLVYQVRASFDFNLGTSPDSTNLIKDGIVTSSSSDTFFGADALSVTLYGHVSSSTLTYSLGARTNLSTEYFVDIDLPVGTIFVGSPAAINLKFTCFGSGSAATDATTLTFNVTSESDGTQTILLNLTKLCSFPKLQLGTTKVSADIVQDGTINPNWQYTAASNETATSFVVWLTADAYLSSQPFSIYASVVPSTNIALNVTVSDTVARPLALGSQPTTITVWYSCKPSEVTQFAFARISLIFGWLNPITFQWTKVCPISSPNPRLGLSIALIGQGPANVAVDGSPLSPWDSLPGYAYSADATLSNLFLRLSQVASGTLAIQRFSASYSQAVPAGVFSVTAPTGLEGVLLAHADRDVLLQLPLMCQSEGSASLTLTLAVPPYDSLPLSLTKTCAFPRLHVGSRAGLARGDLVADGVEQPASRAGDAGALVVSEQDSSTTLFVWLSDGADPAQRSFGTTVFSSTPLALQVALAQSSNTSASSGPQRSQIRLEYTCSSGSTDNAGKGSVVNVVLSFGWKRDLSLTLTKHCPIVPAAPDASKKLDAATIAAIALSTALVSFCVVAAVARACCCGKRGLEALPCGESLRWCWLRCRGAEPDLPRFTPQTDYAFDLPDDPVSSRPLDRSSGDDYQADL